MKKLQKININYLFEYIKTCNEACKIRFIFFHNFLFALFLYRMAHNACFPVGLRPFLVLLEILRSV